VPNIYADMYTVCVLLLTFKHVEYLLHIDPITQENNFSFNNNDKHGGAKTIKLHTKVIVNSPEMADKKFIFFLK